MKVDGGLGLSPDVETIVAKAMAKDPGERTNLAKHNPRKAAELRAKLSTWQKRMKAKMPVPNPDYKAEGKK